MAESKILFPPAGFALGLGRQFSNVFVRRVSKGFQTTGRSGITETIEYGVWDEVEVEMDIFGGVVGEAVWGRLHEWWNNTARIGGQYEVIFDADETVNTTLDGTAAFAQKVIPLTSTAGISVGKKYVVIAADLVNTAVVEVASISAGVSVTVKNDLLTAYASGDIFRSLYYWPKCVSLDREAPFWERQSPPQTYTFRHRFMEDRG